MSTPTKDRYPENIVNPNFQKLLDRFHEAIKGNPKPEKIEHALSAIKGDALVTHITGHQRDAIVSRVNNFMKGEYGSTSKEYSVHQHVKK